MRGAQNPSQGNNDLRDLKQRLRDADLSNLSDKDIFHPSGYGKKIAEGAKVTPVQLRRIYYEFKSIIDAVNSDVGEGTMGKLYKLYAIIHYQKNRGVLNRDFADILEILFDKIDKLQGEKRKEGFKKVGDLLEAIVAYSK